MMKSKILQIIKIRKISILSQYIYIKKSNFFDENYYLDMNNDVKNSNIDPLFHYLNNGWKENRNPSCEFDNNYYVRNNSDILGSGLSPLYHYLKYGRDEGRKINGALDAISNNDLISMEDIGNYTESKIEVSIIIPTYNRRRLLDCLIKHWIAVDELTTINYEIIFSDDGSDDGTVDFLEKIEKLPIRVLKNEHGGPSSARNNAIHEAKGEWLIFLGDDIYPDPELINVHLSILKKYGANTAVLGKVDWANDLTVNHVMDHITNIGNEQFSYNRLANNAFTDFRHFYTCNISINRKFLLKQKTLFDLRFDKYGFEDIELGYRLALDGLKIFYTELAFGQHYHPYNVRGFCKRQNSAGEMAIVFNELHPGIGSLIGIKKVESAIKKNKFPKNLKFKKNWDKKIESLINFCELLEKVIEKNDGSSKYKQFLSDVYTNLFKAMYDLGIAKKLLNKDDCYDIIIPMHFSNEWTQFFDDLENRKLINDETIFEERLDLVIKNMKFDMKVHDFKKFVIKFRFSNLKNFIKKKFFHPSMVRLGKKIILNKKSENVSYIKDYAYKIKSKKLIVISNDLNLDEKFHERYLKIFNEYPSFYFMHENQPIKNNLELQNSNDENEIYCYWPKNIDCLMSIENLFSLWLAINYNNIDVSLISYDLDKDGSLCLSTMRDQSIFKLDLINEISEENLSGRRLSAKIIHTVTEFKYNLRKVDYKDFFGIDAIYSKNDSIVSFSKTKAPCRYIPSINTNKNEHVLNKKVIFVFPIFVAVGGVERNTIEIIRKLKSEFNFVVITMERLRLEQGSLVEGFRDAGAIVLEMSEIIEHSNYLGALQDFKNIFTPSLIWICNGSPWLSNNISNIRNLFFDIPIVDQQVYDENEGWINHYRKEMIDCIDIHIAINKKIKRKFENKFQIPAKKVELIYSALDSIKIKEFKSTKFNKNIIKNKYGLPKDKKIFTFVGRLTLQKNPILFLELVNSRKNNEDEFYVLVGDGELGTECNKYISENNLHNIIRIPFVDNTLELASITDGLIISSLFEGLPIAMLEVLNFGVPVLSTDTGDISYFLNKFGGGKIIPISFNLYDEKIKKDINYWFNHLHQYRKSLNNNADCISDYFSVESISLQYSKIFSSSIDKYEKDR